MTEVRGMQAAVQQAEAGLKLFKTSEEPLELDTEEAQKYKTEVEARITALEEEASKLTGKDNKKERAAKGKEVLELKGEDRYIDACKVVKGLEPRHGNFVKNPRPVVCPDAKAEPKPPVETPQEESKKKDAKPKKTTESAGLSPAETKELEQLKKDIIARKEQLKAEGLSGGQQNKDPQVVEWVARMNVLKEKADPGSAAGDKGADAKKKEGKKTRAPLSSEEQQEMQALQQEIEVYRARLKNEFGYNNKSIKADPDLIDMEARLAAFEKREG